MKIKFGPYPNGSEARKEEIHIDPFDTWNMDNTLALIIVPMLKQFKENSVGYPGYFYEKYKGDEEIALKHWNEILDKMIWSFEQVSDNDEEWEDQFFKGDNFNFNLWKEASNKRDKQIQEGLDLFGKWYRNLWD